MNSVLLLFIAAGHPEFDEQTVRSIVDTSLESGKMDSKDSEAMQQSYQQLEPQQDFALLQRICCDHIRKH